MRILYFASLRDKVGTGQEDIALPSEVGNVQALIDWLREQDETHAAALADMSMFRVAVNQEYAQLDHPVSASDEIAFFPPVTGG